VQARKTWPVGSTNEAAFLVRSSRCPWALQFHARALPQRNSDPRAEIRTLEAAEAVRLDRGPKPNHDRRGAYVFQINPLGTQIDGLIVEEQRDNSATDVDSEWDGVWTSDARPNGNSSVMLASLQGNYSFSRFLTFTSLIQMDTSNTQAVSVNLRLRYNYRPDSDLYIIYNVGTQFASIAPANPSQIRETRFAIKGTYSGQP